MFSGLQCPHVRYIYRMILVPCLPLSCLQLYVSQCVGGNVSMRVSGVGTAASENEAEGGGCKGQFSNGEVVLSSCYNRCLVR